MKYLITSALTSFLLLTVLTNTNFAQTEKDSAIGLFNQGKYKQSISLLKKAIDNDKENASLWNYLGVAYLRRSKLGDAIDALEKANKYEQNNSNYRSNLAYAYLINNKPDNAQEESSKAIKLDPQNAKAYFYRSAAFFEEMKLEDALSDAEQSILINDDFYPAYILQSSILLKMLAKIWYAKSMQPVKLSLLEKSVNGLKECMTKCKTATEKDVLRNKLEMSRAILNHFKGIDSKKKARDEKDYKSIEVLERPKPGYTRKAQIKRTTGKVRLAILFGSSGKVEQILVIQGLENGLTELSVRAAKKIKFKPAMRDNKPISIVRTVVYNFR